jgi:hypothetical protein
MSEDTTVIPAPQGSMETEIAPTFGPTLVGSDVLDGLMDEQLSAPMEYFNTSGQPLSYVELVLNPIMPVEGGAIQLVSGDLQSKGQVMWQEEFYLLISRLTS